MQTSLFKQTATIKSSTELTAIFQDLLRDLAHHLGLPELVPNKFNVCSITLDDANWVHISYSAKDRQIHWTSTMTKVTSKDTKSLFSALHAVNLDWDLTQGGYFSFDEVTEVIIYRFHEPLSNLHSQRFLEVTGRFIERSHFWKKRLQQSIDALPLINKKSAATLEVV